MYEQMIEQGIEETGENESENVKLKEVELSQNGMSSRPWYITNGERYPNPVRISKKTNKRLAKLMPYESPRNDRITNQLMFVPHNYEDLKAEGKYKTILLYNGLGPWNVKQGDIICLSLYYTILIHLFIYLLYNIIEGRQLFINNKCPVNTCQVTANRDKASTADLILYKDHYIPTGISKSARQLYMLYFLECPYHTQHIKFPDVFNWTSTYR